MDKQILNLLTEMNKEMKSMKSEINRLNSKMQNMESGMTEIKSEMQNMESGMTELKSEMHERFDKVDAKLKGVGGHFELTNESRMNDVDFIADKVNKIEKELYILKTKS